MVIEIQIARQWDLQAVDAGALPAERPANVQQVHCRAWFPASGKEQAYALRSVGNQAEAKFLLASLAALAIQPPPPAPLQLVHLLASLTCIMTSSGEHRPSLDWCCEYMRRIHLAAVLKQQASGVPACSRARKLQCTLAACYA